MPGCQGARVPGCQGARVPGCQGARVPRCQGARVPGCQGARVPGCQGARVPGCRVLQTVSLSLLIPDRRPRYNNQIVSAEMISEMPSVSRDMLRYMPG